MLDRSVRVFIILSIFVSIFLLFFFIFENLVSSLRRISFVVKRV